MSEVMPFDADANAVARYLGLNPSDPKSHAVIAVCERYKLDPILKHVIVLPKGGVYVTRDGLLHVAHMSGQLDGIVLEEQGENDAEWWAEVSVYRKDMRFPFRYRGRYNKANSNKAYGPEMALKCAEALALRRAFDISGLPVLEERDAAPESETVQMSTERLRAKLSGDDMPGRVSSTAPQIMGAAPETTQTQTQVAEATTMLDEELPLEPEVEILDADIEPGVTKQQLKEMFALFTKLGIDNKDDALPTIADIVGHGVDATGDLTEDEARLVIDTLGAMA